MTTAAYLSQCILFKGLKEHEIELLLNQIHYQEKSFKRESLIAQSGDETTAQLILLSGSVRGEMMDFNGKAIKIEDIKAVRMLAPAFLFGKQNHYPVSIIANEESRVLHIPKNDFLKLLGSNELILRNYLDNISSRAQFLSEKIKFLFFQDIKGKLAHYYMTKLRESSSQTIRMESSQEQLAVLFGVSRPALARSIKELREDKIIETHGKEIRILNVQALKALVRE